MVYNRAFTQGYLEVLEKQARYGAWEISGDIQGVGARKQIHSTLDQLGVPGIAVNYPNTGKVKAFMDEKYWDQVRKELLQHLLTETDVIPKFKRMYNVPKNIPVQLSPEEIQNFIKNQKLTRLGAKPLEDQLQYLIDRYRLENQKGTLVGEVPLQAAQQLRGEAPIYSHLIWSKF